MKPLDPPELYHLRAAVGWLELGKHIETNEELESAALSASRMSSERSAGA